MYLVLELRTYLQTLIEKQLFRLKKNIWQNSNMRIFLSCTQFYLTTFNYE